MMDCDCVSEEAECIGAKAGYGLLQNSAAGGVGEVSHATRDDQCLESGLVGCGWREEAKAMAEWDDKT